MNINAVARKDEDARDGDKKAPERLLEEEKTREDPDKGQLECDNKPKQERDQEEGNDLGVEDSAVAPERLVEGGKAEKDPQGEEKEAVGDEDDTVEEGGVGEHDDTTDGGETELEEGKEEDDDATDVELEMEEEKGTGGGGQEAEERIGLQDVEGRVEEDVVLGDDCIDGGEGDSAQEKERNKRKIREENNDQDDDEEGKNYDQKEEDDEEGKNYDQEEEDDEEGTNDDREEEEQDDEEVDIDAMIKLASSAVKKRISEPTEGSSGGGVAEGKRPASTAAADGNRRPRKIRRGGAIKSLDSRLSIPKGLLNAESEKKRGSLSVSDSAKGDSFIRSFANVIIL